MKEWIGYILAIVFLICSIIIYFVYDSKLDDLQVRYSNEAIESSISASDNTYSIYQFSDYEFNEDVIDARTYSSTLEKLIQTHTKLIEMIRDKTMTETNKETVDLAIQFLETRKEAYTNLKSYVDLSADNFKQVANNKFEESEQIKSQLETLLYSNSEVNTDE